MCVSASCVALSIPGSLSGVYFTISSFSNLPAVTMSSSATLQVSSSDCSIANSAIFLLSL